MRLGAFLVARVMAVVALLVAPGDLKEIKVVMLLVKVIKRVLSKFRAFVPNSFIHMCRNVSVFKEHIREPTQEHQLQAIR